MELLRTVLEITNKISSLKEKGFKIGFVPTMGALHNGHLSLINEVSKFSDYVVVSIFVNPTQFNNSNDLKSYPRDLEADKKLLSNVKCDLLFAPEVSEVYPDGEKILSLNLEGLDKEMEGKYRSGHFQGVVTVVKRLFDIIKPDFASFGQKDFQQLVIINFMVKKLKIPITIISCPIIRQEDGLAMSSRNMLLSQKVRTQATIIYQTLTQAKKLNASVSQIKEYICNKINSNPVFEVEYISIVDSETLQEVEDYSHHYKITACIAVWTNEKVRLIDNIQIK